MRLRQQLQIPLKEPAFENLSVSQQSLKETLRERLGHRSVKQCVCQRSRDLIVYIFFLQEKWKSGSLWERRCGAEKEGARSFRKLQRASPAQGTSSSGAPNLLAVITYLHVCLPLECELLEGRNPVFIHLCIPVPSTVPGSW